MMKKIILSLASIACLSNVAMAENTGFVGLELGYSTIEGDTFFQLGKESASDLSYGVRLGALNDEWRTMFLGTYTDTGDQSVQSGLVSFDYLIGGSDNQFIPYIGGHVGYSKYESDFIDASGFSYGGQVGVIANISSAINIDLAYRYTLAEVDELNYQGALIVALDYKF